MPPKAARLFTRKRLFWSTLGALLLIGFRNGWGGTLQDFGPLHAIFKLPIPHVDNFLAGGLCTAANGYLIGLAVGFVMRIFRSPSKRSRARAGALVGIAFLLFAPAAYATDGGFKEILNQGNPMHNVPALLVTAAGGGIGFTAGIGTVSVIVNGRTTSVTRVDRTAGGGRGGSGQIGGGGPPPLERASPPEFQDHGESRPPGEDGGEGEEEEEPANFTLDIQSDDRDMVRADGKDSVRISASVRCDKPDVDTSGIASNLRFQISGPAGTWLRVEERSTSGSTTRVQVLASPPAPDAELADPRASVTVIMAIGPRTFRGVVDLTVEHGEVELEITFPDA